MEARSTASKPKKAQTWSTGQVVTVVAAISAAALCTLLVWACYVKSWGQEAKPSNADAMLGYSAPGAFGDSFAPIVGIFTSLTLGAAVASVFMQRAELAAQREENEEAREQWRKQATALDDANKLAKHANELAHSAQVLDALKQIAELDAMGIAAVQSLDDRTLLSRGALPKTAQDIARDWYEFAGTSPEARKSTFPELQDLRQLHHFAASRDEAKEALRLLRNNRAV